LWTYWGSSFGWSRGTGGDLGLTVYATWHEPIPDMSGPYPVFEVDEVLRLKGLDLSIDYKLGGEAAALQEVKDDYRARGKKLDENELPAFASVLHVHNGHISLSAFLDDEPMAELLDDFQKFGALSGQKHFWGRFSTSICCGSLSLGVQLDENNAFFDGDLPGIIRDVPRVSFVSGNDVPSKSDDRQTLSALRSRSGFE